MYDAKTITNVACNRSDCTTRHQPKGLQGLVRLRTSLRDPPDASLRDLLLSQSDGAQVRAGVGF